MIAAGPYSAARIWIKIAAVIAISVASASIASGQSVGTLDLKELPGGFALQEARATSNRDVAREMASVTDGRPDAWLRHFDTWGRQDGRRATFVKQASGVMELITSEAEPYGGAAGAATAIQELRRIFSKEVLEKAVSAYSAQIRQFATRSGPSDLNESFVLVFRGTAVITSTVPFDGVQVVWRNANVVHSIGWMVFGMSSVFEADVVALAAKQNRQAP